LIRDDAHGPAIEPGKANDEVPGVVLVDLEEVAFVGYRMNKVEHVVRLVWRTRNEGVKRRVLAVGRVARRETRRIVEIVRRQERQQIPYERQALAVVIGCEMRDAAPGVVGHRATEVLLRHVLVRDGSNHLRSGHEHVARVLYHDHEVGDGR